MMGHKGYIAGGCFKNIFNGEKIKDIDIFFDDEEEFLLRRGILRQSDRRIYRR